MTSHSATTAAAGGPAGPSFPVQARAVARSVAAAFTDLLTSVGGDPHDPQGVSRSFGLNKNLAWKISKIVQADDSSVALTQMPGAGGIRIFLKSMESAGAGPERLAAARQAIAEYEQLIQVHSGDRATLEIMGSELGAGSRQPRDEYHRKLLFQGASYVWGAQARVILKVGVVGPGCAPGLLDFASLNALIDFRRFRKDVTWVIASRQSSNDDGSGMPTSTLEAIDNRYASLDEAPLMADFCSQPLPKLRSSKTAVGTTFELAEGPVGNMGALTCVAGAIQRHIPYYRTPANEWGNHRAVCDTPGKLLIVDLFFHEGFTFAIPPEAILCSELRNSADGHDRLPLSEPLQDLGVSALLPATPEVRRYSAMVTTVFERMGWSPAQFHGFRMKVAYPVCPAALVLRYRLPEGPAS